MDISWITECTKFNLKVWTPINPSMLLINWKFNTGKLTDMLRFTVNRNILDTFSKQMSPCINSTWRNLRKKMNQVELWKCFAVTPLKQNERLGESIRGILILKLTSWSLPCMFNHLLAACPILSSQLFWHIFLSPLSLFLALFKFPQSGLCFRSDL